MFLDSFDAEDTARRSIHRHSPRSVHSGDARISTIQGSAATARASARTASSSSDRSTRKPRPERWHLLAADLCRAVAVQNDVCDRVCVCDRGRELGELLAQSPGPGDRDDRPCGFLPAVVPPTPDGRRRFPSDGLRESQRRHTRRGARQSWVGVDHPRGCATRDSTSRGGGSQGKIGPFCGPGHERFVGRDHRTPDVQQPQGVVPKGLLVSERRLELPRGFPHMALNHARLPIPPLRRNRSEYRTPTTNPDQKTYLTSMASG